MKTLDSSNAKGEIAKAASSDGHQRNKLPLKVGDVMTHEVKTLLPEQSFGEVVSLLAGNSFHHVVVAVDGQLLGMVSDRDVFRQLGLVQDWSSKAVGEIMIKNIVTVTAETLLSTAAGLLLERRIHCLPVVNDAGKLVGIVTSTDLLRLFKTMQERFESLDS